jgi:tetratricopeptide (TPR) repeat protein
MADDAGDPFVEAQALYEKALTPASTRRIGDLLRTVLGNPGSRPPGEVARASALLANILLCDYLNRWNDAGTDALTEAEQAVESALKGAPDDAMAHHVHGFLHRARGRHEEAHEAFGRAVRHKPDFARARAQKANELLHLGRPDQALRDINQAIRTSSGSPSLGMFQWIKGRILFFLGKYREAVPCLEASVAGWPELWYNRLYLVSAYALIGKERKAWGALHRFHERFPEYTTIADVIEGEKTNPNDNLLVVIGRRNFHVGLRLAGMKEG